MIAGIIILIFVVIFLGGGLFALRRRTASSASASGAPTQSPPPATNPEHPVPSATPGSPNLLPDDSPNPTYDIDIERGNILWNRAFYSAFGYDQAEAAHTLQWWATHIHHEDAMTVNEALDHIRLPQTKEWVVNYRFQRADGSYLPVSDRTLVIRNDAGEATHVIGTMTVQAPGPQTPTANSSPSGPGTVKLSS